MAATSARASASRSPAPASTCGSDPVSARAGFHVWLVCDDFDRRYHQTRARVPTKPPQVAFHGDIVFGLQDPDGHALTFSAPATHI
jgi:hypothetical protein